MYIHYFYFKLFKSLALKSDLRCSVFLFGARSGQEEKNVSKGNGQ